MRTAAWAVCAFAGCLAMVRAQEKTQQKTQEKAPGRMEIAVEKKDAAGVKNIDPRHVFESGDLVRFRFRPNFSGYLYVMNHSTSGKYTLLFPTSESGGQNRIEANRDYLLPSSESGWFKIEDPPGHEVVYWLVTPAELGRPDVAPAPMPASTSGSSSTPPGMTPRCDDTIFRARGDCIDTTAGPRPIPRGEAMPGNLADVPRTRERDLVFIRKPKGTVVSAPDRLEGPVIYEFVLAHK